MNSQFEFAGAIEFKPVSDARSARKRRKTNLGEAEGGPRVAAPTEQTSV
jgi:hypothetical protein